MSILNGLFILFSFALFVGCGGGGAANTQSSVNDDQNQANNIEDQNETPENPSNPTEPAPQPKGPQPGDIVAASDPDPNATYPAVGQPIQSAPDPSIEPNTDYERPIIEIVAHPNPYIPTSTSQIELRAADNVGGMGLRDLECQIDNGTWATCSETVDLSNLSEGLHTLVARAVDWDDNQSTEVSYAFYVDLTAPEVMIANSPTAATKDPASNFEFNSSDSGSGVAYYECKIDDGGFQRCNQEENFGAVSEGNHVVEVRAVDSVGNTSASTSHDWTVDYSGPMINVTQKPNSTVYVEDTASVVSFDVTDTYSPDGIQTTCMLNGKAVACGSSLPLSVASTQPEEFTLVITATDALGNMAQETIVWIAVNEAANRSSTITVNDVKPVDILFVVDNSGSMNEERANLAQRIDGMIEVIDGLDWQIAVISTDSTNNNNISDGRLIEMIGLPGEHILDASMNTAFAQQIFGNTVQNFGGGSGTEEGIYSTKRVIDRYLAGQKNHTDFIRDGADLNVVVLSDEDEHSNGNNKRISPQEFLDFFTQSFGPQKNLVWHSIIYRPGDSGCTTGAYEGDEYDELSRLTGYGEVGGAIIGDVCSLDYTSQLADIGQSVKDLTNSIKLKCAPYDLDKDGTPEVIIYHRNDANSAYTMYNAPHIYSGDRVVFDDLLPAGDYKVDYRCKIN